MKNLQPMGIFKAVKNFSTGAAPIEYQIALSIDLRALALYLAHSAITNKSRKSKLAHGLIIATNITSQGVL